MKRRVLVALGAAALTLVAAGCGYGPPPDRAGAGATTGDASASPGGGGTPALDSAARDAQMRARIKAFPAATAGLGGQLMPPVVLPDGTKEFTLTAMVTPWEIEPGKTVQAWTYNGVVPGPTIHVAVGDRVRVVLVNQLPESTSLHFHGMRIPNAMDGVADLTQNPVVPGGTFTHSFTATEPAVGMYHAHDDSLKQVTNGLLGAFLVGEMPLPTGTGKVTQEMPMVLNDSGVIGLTINGKSFPATAPVTAHLGDWLVVHYMNEGQMIHPMHLHGIPQLVTAKDGFPLAQPQMMDTVLVGPGERYTVLIHADAAGAWAWHCHILSHAENASGMFGMVTALIVT